MNFHVAREVAQVPQAWNLRPEGEEEAEEEEEDADEDEEAAELHGKLFPS